MSKSPHSPLLAFSNIWVHGNRPAPLIAPINSDKRIFGIAINRYKKTKQPSNVLTGAKINSELVLIKGACGQLLSGQLTVLTGHSGSGKSVLLRVLAGLSTHRTGNVWLYDKHRRLNSDDTSAAQWRTKVALLAQHPQLVEGSVLDNLKLPYTFQGHQHRSFDIDWHIEQLTLLGRNQSLLHQSAAHLSGGERQLVNTLRLLQLQPQILLLDEPTAALDGETANYLIRRLMKWLTAEPQRSLLWVTHDTQAIMPFTNQYWDMQSGVLSEISLSNTSLNGTLF